MTNAGMIYWIGVVDNLIYFMSTVVALAIVGVIALLVMFAVKSDIDWTGGRHEKEKQTFKRWIILCAVIALVGGLALVFIPGEKRLWAMWIADKMTYENMQSAVDYIVSVVKEMRR